MILGDRMDVVVALKAGLENSLEVLNEHVQRFGRTTKKNKARAILIEDDIKIIKEAIKLMNVV